MDKTNIFKYKGFNVNFGGFYENRFCFYIEHLGRIVMVDSIKELESELLKQNDEK